MGYLADSFLNAGRSMNGFDIIMSYRLAWSIAAIF